MTTRRLLGNGVLVFGLLACVRTPSPGIKASPTAGLEGAYAFAGEVPGAGIVEGAIRFDGSGQVTLSSGGITCAAVPKERNRRLQLSCGRVAIDVTRNADVLGDRASLSVAVTEVLDVPADPFECRGATTEWEAGQSRCVGLGTKRNVRIRWHTVGAQLSRVEQRELAAEHR